MENTERKHKLFGLLGKNIEYSFSRSYFSKKFQEAGIEGCEYVNFDLQSIEELTNVLQTYTNVLVGFNVTIPYKKEILPYLSEIDPIAAQIGAVNTVKLTPKGLSGYNTDVLGFRRSIKPLLGTQHQRALLLGTGGAANAVEFALNQLGITVQYVSRNKRSGCISYEDLFTDVAILRRYKIVVNATPLGTYPNIEDCPNIPYELLSSEHLVYDLIYNPEETTFLKKAKMQGATTRNGYQMLVFQAEAAWEIWNTK